MKKITLIAILTLSVFSGSLVSAQYQRSTFSPAEKYEQAKTGEAYTPTITEPLQKKKSTLISIPPAGFEEYLAIPAPMPEPIYYYDGWEVPAEVLTTIEADYHLGLFGSLAPDLLAKIQHEVTDPVLIEQGITELLSVGVSDYSYSTTDRIYNIQTSLNRFDNQVIQPGENFSFLHLLGLVNEDIYRRTKVIIGGESVDGLGGGVCQTSTTMRRAALYAGMPEIRQKHHTFAVSYYGPLQGLDTTIWSPSVDYQFVNDSNAPIYIKTVLSENPKRVMVFFYGKKDRDTTLFYEGSEGTLKLGMTAWWRREINKYNSSEPIIHNWTAKYQKFREKKP